MGDQPFCTLGPSLFMLSLSFGVCMTNVFTHLSPLHECLCHELTVWCLYCSIYATCRLSFIVHFWLYPLSFPRFFPHNPVELTFPRWCSRSTIREQTLITVQSLVSSLSRSELSSSPQFPPLFLNPLLLTEHSETQHSKFILIWSNSNHQL